MLFHNQREYLLYQTYIYIQPFRMEVDWQEIWGLMDVSTMSYICIYCVFTEWGRYSKQCLDMKWSSTKHAKTGPTFVIPRFVAEGKIIVISLLCWPCKMKYTHYIVYTLSISWVALKIHDFMLLHYDASHPFVRYVDRLL